jgi:hypothetical protein
LRFTCKGKKKEHFESKSQLNINLLYHSSPLRFTCKGKKKEHFESKSQQLKRIVLKDLLRFTCKGKKKEHFESKSQPNFLRCKQLFILLRIAIYL